MIYLVIIALMILYPMIYIPIAVLYHGLKDRREPEATEFKGTPQNVKPLTAEQIDAQVIATKQLNNINILAKEYKPIIYSEHDLKYMPKN